MIIITACDYADVTSYVDPNIGGEVHPWKHKVLLEDHNIIAEWITDPSVLFQLTEIK